MWNNRIFFYHEFLYEEQVKLLNEWKIKNPFLIIFLHDNLIKEFQNSSYWYYHPDKKDFELALNNAEFNNKYFLKIWFTFFFSI